MFSEALLKRFDDLPELSPKQAESKYWARPHVDYGCALKLAHRASGLDGDGADAVRAALEAGERLEDAHKIINAAEKAATEATTKLNNISEEIGRLCVALGVDPAESVSDIVDSVVDLVNATDNGTGETVDKTGECEVAKGETSSD